MATGADLRKTRETLGVRVTDLARAMGVQHPRISHIEALASVTPRAERRYLDALQTVVNGESSRKAA